MVKAKAIHQSMAASLWQLWPPPNGLPENQMPNISGHRFSVSGICPPLLLGLFCLLTALAYGLKVKGPGQ